MTRSTGDRGARSWRVRAGLGRWTVAVVLVLGSVLLPSAPAGADDWGTGTSDTGATPDGGRHSFCWGSGFDVALRDNADSAMRTSLDSPTDVSVVFLTTCADTTDVIWRDGNLSGTIRGQTVCRQVTLGGKCERNDITLDPAEINKGTNDQEDTTKTACHEVGHSVGLTHGSGGGDGRFDDCMVSGESTLHLYSQHHKNHINAYF